MEKRGDVGTHTPTDKPCCGGQCRNGSLTKKSELQVQKDLLDRAAEPKKSV